jgi:hypothetical protein
MTQTVDSSKIKNARRAVDAYREAHRQLHEKGWYKGISEDHTPLLTKLVDDLEKAGFTSDKTDFETKKEEILTKLWADSDELNAKELGYASKEDFNKKASKADREALELKWR